MANQTWENLLDPFPNARGSALATFTTAKDVSPTPLPFLGANENIGGLVFSQDARHVAWFNQDHSVSLCDLTEVQRAMAEFGLGW